MAFGIQNATNTSLDFINGIVNVTSPMELLINVNNDIYGGWLYFTLLLLTWVILYFAANSVLDQPLNNIMYAGAVVTVISILLRGIEILQSGVFRGLLTDFQMWFFPLVTILVAMLIWFTKD